MLLVFQVMHLHFFSFFSNMTSEITSQINDTATYPLDYYLHGYEPVIFNSDQSQYVSVIGPDRIAVTIVM